MKNHRYYLGKLGKIFGPFSQEEFDELVTSGKIEQYVWLWDFKTHLWKPLEAPPPPVRDSHEFEHAPSGATAGVTPIRTGLKDVPIPSVGVHAICHNFLAALSGEISQVTQTGCEFYLASGSEARNPFGNDSQVYLNLFESQTGRSVQVKAKISKVSNTRYGRCYSFRWSELPKIFENAA